MVQTLPVQSLRVYNSGRMTGRVDFMSRYLPGGRYCIGICRETRQEPVRKKDTVNMGLPEDDLNLAAGLYPFAFGRDPEYAVALRERV